MGQGTDRDWLEKLRTCQSLKKTQHFQLPKIKVCLEYYVMNICFIMNLEYFAVKNFSFLRIQHS